MPRQTEPNANNTLGGLLQGMMPRSRVRSEHTQAIAGHPGRRPDILITAEGRAPIVIEAEYMPGANVEAEARSRLGLEATSGGRVIEAAIGLRYPEEIRQADDLRAALSKARLSYCVFTEENGEASRFPDSGWMNGSVEDVADMVRLVSVPQRAVEQAADALQEGIDGAARILDEMAEIRPFIIIEIAGLLGMANVPQTRRMACAIIANAMVFQERLAGMHEDVKTLSQVCGADVSNPKEEALAAWGDILKVNYWAIFAIARDILLHMTAGDAARVLRRLMKTAQDVNTAGVENAHDLTGRIFQRLIADRKYLATFYTRPASASLLARLAVSKMQNVDWANAEAIGKLRIGDFACGTGALLSAVYEQIAARHERAGGDTAALHKTMMEEVLYGCDVMPSAVHITGSTLSGVEPSVGYENSRLYTMPYGPMEDGSVAIGSLELLQSSDVLTLINLGDSAKRTGSAGEQTAAQVRAEVPDDGFDLVIMNPPFTSDTKHRDSADGVLNAAFAAFDASRSDQSKMAGRLKRFAAGMAYHGHAGLGSAFASLAARKLRPGGVIAMVLPFTATNGSSWAKFRELLAAQFTDLSIVSITDKGHGISFSSDTGIAECLVIGRKTALNEEPAARGTFVSLRSRPASFVESQEISSAIFNSELSRSLEDGPYGGVPIFAGDDLVGELLNAPVGIQETGWKAGRILDASVAQTAHALSTGRLWLPGQAHAQSLPIKLLKEVGERGPDSQLLISSSHQGPFYMAPASETATYPALWNHNAKSEKRIVSDPDVQLFVKPGMEDRAATLWGTASRVHLNRDFRFTSQALAATMTMHKSMGGVAWPTVLFDDHKLDSSFVIWCNTTLGLLEFWWTANRQQSGRGRKTIRSSAETLPVLDLRALADSQLRTAESVFDEFRDKDLKPAYLADADPNRALLDRRMVCDILGFDEDIYAGVRRLAAKWCAEPSVHGGKPRPKNAKLVI